jgi:hypothetical protein
MEIGCKASICPGTEAASGEAPQNSLLTTGRGTPTHGSPRGRELHSNAFQRCICLVPNFVPSLRKNQAYLGTIGIKYLVE